MELLLVPPSPSLATKLAKNIFQPPPKVPTIAVESKYPTICIRGAYTTQRKWKSTSCFYALHLWYISQQFAKCILLLLQMYSK